MATIYEILNAKFNAAKWAEDINERPPYLFEGFFKERKQLGIDLAMLKGKRPHIRPLDLSAWDVKVNPLVRGSISKVETEMPFFKNSLTINERQRQDLLKVLATGNQAYIDAILDEVYNDNKHLLEDARLTREIMRAQLVTTGAIAMASNGQEIYYDYDVPEANKITLTSTAKWDAPSTAQPIANIKAWQLQIQQKTGRKPTNIVMNSTTFALMAQCDSVKNTIYVFADGKVLPDDEQVKELVRRKTGCTIYIYDDGYYAQGSTEFTKFVADNTVCLFTDDALGEFVFGTTPEEADLMYGSSADVIIVDGGVALSTYKENDSVSVATKVSMVGMPTLNNADGLIIADVA